jgi:hypothetical protein
MSTILQQQLNHRHVILSSNENRRGSIVCCALIDISTILQKELNHIQTTYLSSYEQREEPTLISCKDK